MRALCCTDICSDPDKVVDVKAHNLRAHDPSQEVLVRSDEVLTSRSPRVAHAVAAGPTGEDLVGRFHRRWGEASEADQQRLEAMSPRTAAQAIQDAEEAAGAARELTSGIKMDSVFTEGAKSSAAAASGNVDSWAAILWPTGKQSILQRCLRFALLTAAYIVLFIAWWFGARRLDGDGDGDFDYYDVQLVLEDMGMLKQSFARRKKVKKVIPPRKTVTAPRPKATAKPKTRPPALDDATVPDGRDAACTLDGVLGNGDGTLDVEDLVESKVSGIDEEAHVAEMLMTGQAKPWFIVCETCLALALWLVFALKTAVEGTATTSFWATKAGLDSISEGDLDLRTYQDGCVDLRHQFWRWWTYQFTHVGILHVLSNSLFNIIFGIPMEGIHGSAKICLMYNVGVVGGALMFVVTSTHSVVVGMSGGCYSLLGMHVADLVMNWSNKKYRKPTVIFILVMAGTDLAQYFSIQDGESVSHAAHAGGYVAGICIGVVLGKNFRVKRWERVLSALTLLLGIGLAAYSLIWLIAAWPPKNFWEPDGWCWKRQIINVEAFGDEWQCVRCGGQACIDRWGSERYVAVVSIQTCDSQGWAVTDGAP